MDTIRPWMHELFGTIDRMDARAFARHLTDDGRFCFANQPPVQGTAAIERAVGGFFASIASLSHRLTRAWERDDTAVVEGEVTYVRRDGRAVTLPFCNTFTTRAGRVADYRIYVDVAPLYAP